MYPLYLDRCWCSRAEQCSHTPCSRRLKASDIAIIKQDKWMVSYNEFSDCKDFKEKQNVKR